jgi:transposase-like protein
MTSRYCPNCNCFKEVSEVIFEDESQCVCLSCNLTFSFTIKKPVESETSK